ncbi:ABC transporter ATP-binding protein [Rhizorhabdus sp.]|jgi:iron complex transport system ATP-binding protein|uniref:ABC transporter ATP-binding protein n=1 Tax=Rhizorhabdus sp. TaxID=1968843 RepID=UPI001B720A7B|nr:ABC transporter ATP-binding protein [Rhizorhabdus sp.]MBP8231899.1 ABC transporter ATP-binding protein [Rhizorhabdus sp.]
MVTVSVRDLVLRLGDRAVVDGVSADLQGGSLIGIIGPNGAGKSTLVRGMLGLLPAASGEVRIDGRAIADIAPSERAKRLAYLPQGQNLHWPLSVERLVALGRLPHMGPLSRMSDADRSAVVEAMQRTEIEHLAQRTVTELSGGERARVMMARALAVGAGGLLADEPLAALDPGHQIDMMALLDREAKQGALVVVVLHDLTMAARHCGRILLMNRGHIVADGTPEAVMTSRNLSEVYGIKAYLDHVDGVSSVIALGRG